MKITFISLVALIVLISGCSSSSNDTLAPTTSESGASDNQSRAETGALSLEKFNDENYSRVLANPNGYKDAEVEITGKVFANPKESNGTWQFQIWTDPTNNEGNTIVIATLNIEIKPDDYVKVMGRVEKEVSYDNPMGGTISAPLIQAVTVSKISAIEVLAPTKNTVDTNQNQNQHGIAITVEKLEFADSETRVYVKVKNNSSTKASFYDFNAKMVQGSTQFEPKNTFDESYPEIQSEILPGIETSGIIVFPTVNYSAKSLKIFLEASSENYQLDFKPFVYEVKW